MINVPAEKLKWVSCTLQLTEYRIKNFITFSILLYITMMKQMMTKFFIVETHS